MLFFELGQGVDGGGFAFADDGGAIAESFDFGKDVAGEEDGFVGLFELFDFFLENVFHQRVKTAGGFVHDVEWDVAGEGGDESDFLAVAFAVGAEFFGGIQFEAFEEMFATFFVEPSPEFAQDVNDFATGKIGPEIDFAGDVGELVVKLEGFGPGVLVEEFSAATGFFEQSQEDANGSGFPCSIGTEESMDFPFVDGEVEPVESFDLAEFFD